MAYVDYNGTALFTCASVPIGAQVEKLVILCPSLGHEYERSHRGLGQCAVQLARAGIPAIRFDYSNTGDSAEDPVAGPSRWGDEAAFLAQHFSGVFGVSDVTFLGLRFGAFAASAAAMQTAGKACLWHPVSGGAALLNEWEARHRDMNDALGRALNAYGDAILGWEIPRQWREEMSTLSLQLNTSSDIVASSSEDISACPRDRWHEVPQNAFWQAADDEGMVPGPAIAKIVDLLRGGAS